MRRLKILLQFLIASTLIFFTVDGYAQKEDSTYAEMLGFPKGAKVVIMHVDDVGMSFDSDRGAIEAMTKGVATSCSIMMPCGWVPHFFHYLADHPNTDAGLHLTLTSEWKDYRWGPLSGKKSVPGLVDKEGAFWPSVEEVVTHASADEVDKEMHAQLDRARAMGWEPTHMDSHMGTLFAVPAYTERYIKLGIENHIPVMFPGGHATLIMQQVQSAAQRQSLKVVGRQLWNAGLPVLDDIFNDSYGWKLPRDMKATDENLRKFKTQKYIEALKTIKPGITYVIMHCTLPSETFSAITDSGPIRKGDLLAMTDPALKKFIEKEGIILTSWRELSERRKGVATK
ncbi:MAG TPA: polysaccharide deacetylase family protein [Chitinophagaceae bacterium]|jgi:Uncharacterized protein conserved in bacteria